MIPRSKPITVLIVEDNRFMQQAIGTLLNGDAELQVIGTAGDPYQARDLIMEHRPDVITLDIEMPRMDGITFLEKLMHARPTPVVMVTGTSERNADIALRALELGAFEVIAKPNYEDMQGLLKMRGELRRTVKAAFGMRHTMGGTPVPRTRALPQGDIAHNKVIGIGASTGGVEALRILLSALTAPMPPIAVVQHMPAEFIPSFAARLDRVSALNVLVAEDGQTLSPGHVYIAPGDRHLEIHTHPGGDCFAQLRDSDAVNGHRPSVDMLFSSLAAHAGKRTIGLLMTGMGRDGARGLLELRKAGARTLAQNEESCVVFGMPGAAARLGAVEELAALADLPQVLCRHCQKTGRDAGTGAEISTGQR